VSIILGKYTPIFVIVTPNETFGNPECPFGKIAVDLADFHLIFVL